MEIRHIRNHFGMTQGEFASKIGVNIKTVGNAERGRTTQFGPINKAIYDTYSIEQIAEALEDFESYERTPHISIHHKRPMTGMITVICSECGWGETTTETRATFCGMCGSRVKDRCHKCGSPFRNHEHLFCSVCGTPTR